MKKIVVSLFIILLAFVLVGCPFFPPDETIPEGDEIGEIEFSVDLSYPKSIGYNVTQVTVTLTYSTDTSITATQSLLVDAANEKATGIITDLRIGTWNIEAELFESGASIGTGTGSILVESNVKKTTAIHIDLASGDAEIVVTWGDTTFTGWRYPFYDLNKSNFNPNGSSLPTSGAFTEQWTVTTTEAVQILTGDVTGDGFIEVIFVDSGTLKVYNSSGTELWNISVGSNTRISMIEDVDGDQIDDIGVGQWGGEINAYFYDGSGTLLSTISRTGGYDAGMEPVACLSGNRIVMGLNAGYSKDPRGVAIFDFLSGNETWYYDIGPATMGPVIADLDNDGKIEFILNTSTVNNGASGSGYNNNGTTTTDGQIWTIVVDEDGNEKYSDDLGSHFDGDLFHCVIDLDNDGDLEILAFEIHDSYYTGTSKIHVRNGATGSVISTFTGPQNVYWLWSVADINNDGYVEIITGTSNGTVYIVDKDMNLLTSSSMSTSSIGITVNDVNGDGALEILAADGNTLRILDSNLSELWSFTVGGTINAAAWGDAWYGRGIRTSDLNGDGRNEIIFSTDNKLYVLEGS